MNYCETCRAEHPFTIKKEPHVFRFRGQEIELERSVAYCNNCGSLVDVEELENETMANVAQIYSEKYGMTSPEIRNVRLQFNLGIRPFAKLLNIGSASVTRYESGACRKPPIWSFTGDYSSIRRLYWNFTTGIKTCLLRGN